MLKRLLITTSAIFIPILLVYGCVGNQEGHSLAMVGEPAPNFILPDLNGQSVSLSDFDGKPVLINFWNTGCPPCRKEMPYLQEIYDYDIYHELILLTINIGESATKVQGFLEDNHLSLPVLLDSDGAVTMKYGMPGIPTTFFVDREGILRDKVIGGFPNKSSIESRLSKIP
ncbi:MAG: redoxin domain-containing protein [Dehalococcoidales bacterium]|nr:redoxin domain-containing protein [Dehalococcoidales bacterium]